MKANQAETHWCAVRTMCEVLGVSPSGYYDWLGRKPSQRAIDNEALSEPIQRIHRASDGT
jgi:putative transposase